MVNESIADDTATGAAEVRLPPVPVDEWDDDTRAMLLQYLRRPEVYLSGAPDAPPMPQALGFFANHTELADAWLRFSATLAVEDAAIDPYIRELLVLRVAWRTRSEYEWLQHIRAAKHNGATTEQLYAVPDGADSPVWTPLERDLLKAVDQIVDRHGVDESTWNSLAAHFDARQLLELLFVIGSYLCLATVFNSAGLPADPPTEHVDAPTLPEREN